MSTEGSRVGTAAASGDEEETVPALPGAGGSVADRGSVTRGNQAASEGDRIRDIRGICRCGPIGYSIWGVKKSRILSQMERARSSSACRQWRLSSGAQGESQ